MLTPYLETFPFFILISCFHEASMTDYPELSLFLHVEKGDDVFNKTGRKVFTGLASMYNRQNEFFYWRLGFVVITNRLEPVKLVRK